MIIAMYNFFKRLFDISIGMVLFLLSLPIIVVASIFIRIESKGSPFFIQHRVGLNGKVFRIIKLRGMYIDSRERFPELYDYSGNVSLDFHFHYVDDPRITKVGKITRKYSIDELPNFINVIIGDMSLVGPRPEIPDVLNLYAQYKTDYVSVKPGITCLSKISGRDTLTKLQTIHMDLEYIKSKNFFVDLNILYKTFCQVVLKKNVY